ncbi:MAG: helicase-related protein [Gammaproteobacteria bacterium]
MLATAIHGNKSQGARTTALTRFKQRKVRVLVRTDVAARGIDVVNFDMPNAGRTIFTASAAPVVPARAAERYRW